MEYYLYIKAFHIVVLISWMVMLFYLPRLFVYHAQHRDNESFVSIVETQEQRLYKYIGMPAILLSILTGIGMLMLNPALFSVKQSGLWLHLKLVCVIMLVIYHLLCGYFIKTLGNNTCSRGPTFFRYFNEIPTFLFIIIVFLVVCKPL